MEGHDAVLDYRVTGQVMTITHTEVPAPISGRGVAAALMGEALTAAHTAGWSVIPECSYAASYLRRHPQPEQRPDDTSAT
jgi:predicted GNAT family acetyltransferase